MSIVKRCIWLAEYIDRKDNGDPHGVMWQIMDDIKDIGAFLKVLDDSYFVAPDRFEMPVVDMFSENCCEMINDLFERMEQYVPVDSGIFTKCLLPYEFTGLSTGEYQYAKVLGAVDDFLEMRETVRENGEEFLRKRDIIILMDEPETYMHPELCRQFINRLTTLVQAKLDNRSVQIIISSHSPFMLSDVLPQNITRLNIDDMSGECLVLNGSDKAYFGGNIHTIMSDGFFLKYTVGEYARVTLQQKLDLLKHWLSRGEPLSENEKEEERNIRKIVTYIGDELIKRSFDILLNQLRIRKLSGEEDD